MLRGIDVNPLSGLGVSLSDIRAALGGTVHDNVDLVIGKEVIYSLGIGQVELDVRRTSVTEAGNWS